METGSFLTQKQMYPCCQGNWQDVDDLFRSQMSQSQMGSFAAEAAGTEQRAASPAATVQCDRAAPGVVRKEGL